VKRFLLVSTIAVHSYTGAQDMTEESPQLPTPFPYNQSKREAEALVMGYHDAGKIEVSIVRPGDVYGPGDRVALMRMAPMLEAGIMGTVGDGESLGALTYVENLADGIILAGTVDGAAGEAYVITDGIKVTWREYSERLTGALDAPGPRFSIPAGLAYAIASASEFVYRFLRIKSRPPFTRYLVEHLTHDVHFSIAKAQRDLGYEPQVGIDEAFERTAAWYRRVIRGEAGDD
jgi:nucleoside-diphosphate-sugar epimerase